MDELLREASRVYADYLFFAACAVSILLVFLAVWPDDRDVAALVGVLVTLALLPVYVVFWFVSKVIEENQRP